MTRSHAPVAPRPVIETRSIDYIPENERHGSAFGQFTLWLGVNLNITAIVTGALAVVLGGDVFWSLIGLLIGQVLGSIVMGLQAAQGPAIGLPQMIRSRVQFGVYGAVIPLVLVSLLYVGFSAGGTLLAGQSVAKVLSIADWQGISVRSGNTVFGYPWISRHPFNCQSGQCGGGHCLYLHVRCVAGQARYPCAARKPSFCHCQFRFFHIFGCGLADFVWAIRGRLFTILAQ